MILIALGANLDHPDLGPPPAVFDAAIGALAARGMTLAGRSRLYEGKAIGPGDQPDYVNAAVKFSSGAKPWDVMTWLLEVERALGRVRDVRWGPRTLDMDLIGHGRYVLPSMKRWRAVKDEDAMDALVVPHPRAHKRAFVLRPLMDIAPDWRHPVLNRTVAELYGAFKENTLKARAWE